MPELILIHETESACRQRLVSDGFSETSALQISSYLAQSTDLALEFDEIAQACSARGLSFHAVELDDAPQFLVLRRAKPAIVWTLTDGIAYFRGSIGPALARLNGIPVIGSDDALFALCQDKFRAGSVMRALGLPVPDAGLARNGEWLAPPPESRQGWFVKPDRLGAKIGIWPDSHVTTLEKALELSRRIYAAYRDDALVQTYVPGRNARASYLAVEPGKPALGSFFVDAGGDFQTMEDSLALYGDTGAQARADGAYSEPELVAVAASQTGAAAAIEAVAARAMSGLGLRDVFSMDFRVEEDDSVHLLEFEVCPGLPCFDFRDYCRRHWNMSLPEAMAATAASRMF
ncbi:MAG: D-alanine:D-lactate ligase-like protein [Mesorhizobium sp.]